jgi:hypothetical protein
VRAASIDGPPSLRLSADTHVLDDTPTMMAACDYGSHGADPLMMMIAIAGLHRSDVAAAPTGGAIIALAGTKN